MAGAPQQIAYSQYDFSTGLLTGFKDRNGIITQSIYSEVCAAQPGLAITALGLDLRE